MSLERTAVDQLHPSVAPGWATYFSPPTQSAQASVEHVQRPLGDGALPVPDGLSEGHVGPDIAVAQIYIYIYIMCVCVNATL